MEKEFPRSRWFLPPIPDHPGALDRVLSCRFLKPLLYQTLMVFRQQYIGSGGSLIYAKPTRESKARNEALKERKARRGKDGTTTPPEKFVSKEER